VLPGRSGARDSQETLAEYEEYLRRVYPDGAPSDDGTGEYDRFVAIQREELRWQLRFKRLVLLVGLGGVVVSLALGIVVLLERIAA
jgi:hypothetical protein